LLDTAHAHQAVLTVDSFRREVCAPRSNAAVTREKRNFPQYLMPAALPHCLPLRRQVHGTQKFLKYLFFFLRCFNSDHLASRVSDHFLSGLRTFAYVRNHMWYVPFLIDFIYLRLVSKFSAWMNLHLDLPADSCWIPSSTRRPAAVFRIPDAMYLYVRSVLLHCFMPATLWSPEAGLVLASVPNHDQYSWHCFMPATLRSPVAGLVLAS